MELAVGLMALLAAAAALFCAWRLQRELDRSTSRLDRYNKTLFQANDEVRQLSEQLACVTAVLRIEIMQRTGGGFAPGMTVREAQLLHPQTQQVLAAYHVGGCSSCAVDPDVTLAAVGQDRGLDVNVLLASLNALLKPPVAAAGSAPLLLKVPNVQIEFDR